MIKKNLLRSLGISFSGLGVLSIFMNASKSITGNVIADNYFSGNLSFLIGIILIFVGTILIMATANSKESK